MSHETPDDAPVPASTTDPEPLRDRPDVPVHEETDVVEEAAVERLAEFDDMAPVGVTNEDGEVLVMRITDTCRWKIPSASVAPDEDFAESAREWVESNSGLEIDYDGLEAVWHLELHSESSDRAETRDFVVFSASPVDDDPTVPAPDLPDDEAAAEAGWFTTLPEDAAEVPGTELFFD